MMPLRFNSARVFVTRSGLLFIAFFIICRFLMSFGGAIIANLIALYTPVANLFLDVDQILLDKRECGYLIHTNGSYVPELAY